MLESSCKLCHRLALNERMWLRLWWFLVHCCSFCTITVDICVWDLLIFTRTSNITLLKKVVTCERREQVWKITMTLVMFLHSWGDCESCTCAANALSSNIEFALCVYTCLICDIMYKYLVVSGLCLRFYPHLVFKTTVLVVLFLSWPLCHVLCVMNSGYTEHWHPLHTSKMHTDE